MTEEQRPAIGVIGDFSGRGDKDMHTVAAREGIEL